jgi:hypothetical protein
MGSLPQGGKNARTQCKPWIRSKRRKGGGDAATGRASDNRMAGRVNATLCDRRSVVIQRLASGSRQQDRNLLHKGLKESAF